MGPLSSSSGLLLFCERLKGVIHRSCLLLSCADQLKEFQQKSSPLSVGGEKVAGGAGAKKKRKVKGLSQQDATSTDRGSPDNVSPHSFHVFT